LRTALLRVNLADDKQKATMAYRADTPAEKARYKVFLGFYFSSAISGGLMMWMNIPFVATFIVVALLFSCGVYVMATNRWPLLGQRRNPLKP
jgi:hypothetical protein